MTTRFETWNLTTFPATPTGETFTTLAEARASTAFVEGNSTGVPFVVTVQTAF
jgi:hypothetical protein